MLLKVETQFRNIQKDAERHTEAGQFEYSCTTDAFVFASSNKACLIVHRDTVRKTRPAQEPAANLFLDIPANSGAEETEVSRYYRLSIAHPSALPVISPQTFAHYQASEHRSAGELSGEEYTAREMVETYLAWVAQQNRVLDVDNIGHLEGFDFMDSRRFQSPALIEHIFAAAENAQTGSIANICLSSGLAELLSFADSIAENTQRRNRTVRLTNQVNRAQARISAAIQ